jgi:hypothetical protein
VGDSASWIAVRGKAPQRIRAELGLRLVPEGDFSPEALLAGELESGWYVVEGDIAFARNDRLRTISLGGEVISCALDTSMMFSCASSWVAGVPAWAVTHDEQRDPFDLSTIGTLPRQFGEIRARMLLKQQAAIAAGKNVDCIFNIPILLAEDLTGFRSGYGPGTPDFHLLAPVTRAETERALAVGLHS